MADLGDGVVVAEEAGGSVEDLAMKGVVVEAEVSVGDSEVITEDSQQAPPLGSTMRQSSLLSAQSEN